MTTRIYDMTTGIPDLDHQSVHDNREELSKKYILGKGLEIGALNRPLPIRKEVQVIYIDRVNLDDARNVHFPELKDAEIANVDVIDNAEELNSIPLESHDFIIAGHFLEHTQNPIKTIESQLSKLRVGGILYYILPDKRYTFDIDRKVTPFEHNLQDYKKGEHISYDEHMYEYAELVDHAKTKEQIESRVKQLKEMAYTIHFHVWDAKTLKIFFEKTNEVLGNPFKIIDFRESSKYENIIILRKVKSLNKNFKDDLKPDTPMAIRALMQVFKQRGDLQPVFPEAKEKNYSRIIKWAKKHGVEENTRLNLFRSFYENFK